MASEVPDPTDDALSYDILTGMREWRFSIRMRPYAKSSRR
jgi:hypothetical protein